MAKFTVDSDEINSTTSAAQTQIGVVETATSDLSTLLGTLQSSWSGAGALAFQDAVDEWNNAQRTVEDAITALNGALGMAGDAYGDTESSVVGLFR